MDDLRTVAASVAVAVATTAAAQGLNRVPLTNPVQQVTDAMWHIDYPTLEIVEA
jgi:malate dehydrogenase (oxaloacetate-decarboxylating)